MVPAKGTPSLAEEKSTYNRKAVAEAAFTQDPDLILAKEAFGRHLLDCPAIPVSVELTSQQYILDEYIMDGIEEHFPIEQISFKQPFLSWSTKSLFKKRAVVNSRKCWVAQKLASACSWFVFRFWMASTKFVARSGVPRPWWCRTRGPKTRSMCLRQLKLAAEYDELTIAVRNAVKDDFAACYENKAVALEEASLENCTSKLFFLLRSLQPWKPRKTTRLLDEGGQPAASDESERSIIKRSFQVKLDGHDTRMEDLILEDRDCQSSKAAATLVIPRDLECIPALTYFITRNSHAKLKGTGESGLGGEIKRLFPRHYARLLHPLHTKVAMQLRLPIQWCGGCLHELHKSGAMDNISNYRDICLADLNSKDYGAFLRTTLMIASTALAGPCQFGSGLNGGTTDICNLAVSSFCSFVRCSKASGAILFIDVSSVFSSVARRIVAPIAPESEEAWRRHLHACGYAVDDANLIVSLAMTLLQWEQAGAKAHAVAMLEEFLATTWFSVDGLSFISRCIQGTLAGTSLADLVFIIAMSRIMGMLNAKLVDAGLLTLLPTEPAISFFNLPGDDLPIAIRPLLPTWVDDLAILLRGHSSEIFNKIKATFTIADSVFTMFKLKLNLAPKKTACMPIVAGPGSENLRRAIADLENSCLVVEKFDATVAHLPVVRSYKHMGKCTRADGVVLSEIFARHSSATSHFSRLQKRFFKRQKVSNDKKDCCCTSFAFLSRALWCRILPDFVGHWKCTHSYEYHGYLPACFWGDLQP